MSREPRHPDQPTYRDPDGVVRFKKNEIVDFLLRTGRSDMNELARMPFDREDRIQFAQLIGYSVGGFHDLSYVQEAIDDGDRPEKDAAPIDYEAMDNARIERIARKVMHEFLDTPIKGYPE